MTKPLSEFAQFCLEMMALLAPVSAKKMFGGYGIYKNSVMFALIVNDVLYLKTNLNTKSLFIEKQLEPFTYQKQGKTQTIAYYQCPEEAFDDETIMLSWAKVAYLVAIEAASSENKHKIKIV